MFERSRQDLEAQSVPVSSNDAGYLRSRLPSYQTDLKTLRGRKNSELLEELFWFQNIGSSTSSKSFNFSGDDSFGESLVNLRRSLEEETSNCTAPSLQLCILNTTPVLTDIYTWFTRVLATNSKRLSALVSFPRYAVAIEIEEAWGRLSECSYRSIKHPEQLSRVDQLSLPEFRRQFLSHTTSECTCKRFMVSDITTRYHRQPLPSHGTKFGSKMPTEAELAAEFFIELPSRAVHRDRTFADEALTTQCSRIFLRDTASFTFTWQRRAPQYHGGFDTFLWERYNKPPTCSFAEVFYQDDRATSLPRRVLLAVSTSSIWMEAPPLLNEIRTLLGDSEEASSFMRKLSVDEQKDCSSLLPMLLVFEQVVSDSAVFLKQACDEVMKISFAGRSGASIEKIQYLCHLNDCRESAALSLEHVQSVIMELISLVRDNVTNSLTSELKFLEEKEKDVTYLLVRLEGLKGLVETQFQLIKGHRELAQTRQMSTLTYIATIWVPLSFVTGLLGMQVSDPSLLFHHRSAASTTATSNSTVAARQESANATSTTATPTLVALLASQLAQDSVAIIESQPSGPYVWSFGFFLVVACVFFVTSLLLPLVGPNLLRIAVQRSYKIRNLLVFWPFVFTFYYISVYWMIPEIMQAALRCQDDEDMDYCINEKDNQYLYIFDFNSSGINPVNTITYVISAVVMGAIGLTNLALAVMFRKGAVSYITWLGFAVVVIVVYFLDFYESVEEYFPFPIGTGLSLSAVVPVVYLVVVWSAPQLWYLWKRHFRPQNKAKTM